MSSELLSAAIGFFGVLVGAFISTGANYLLATRKEKADAARDRRARAEETKVAARLVTQDLVELHASLSATLAVEMFDSCERSIDAWQRFGSILARELSHTEWITVNRVAVLFNSFQRARVIFGTDVHLNENTIGLCRDWLQSIELAQVALAKYTADDLVAPKM